MAKESFFFDDLDNKLDYQEQTKPIWSIDLDNPDSEKEVLNWLQGTLSSLKEKDQERIRAMQRNLDLYRGIQYLDQNRPDVRQRGEDRTAPIQKIVANHLFDLVQNRVARLIKFKPAVAIMPTNNEFSDKAAAKATQQLLDHIWYNEKFEGELTVNLAKMKSVLGEVYLFIEWNPDKGDLHPDYKKQSGKIPLLDEDGEQQKDDSGNPVWIDRPIRVGDVNYTIVSPFDVFTQDVSQWKEAKYLFKRTQMTAEDLRLKYPKKAKNYVVKDRNQIMDYKTGELKSSKDIVEVWTFYHRRSLGMDKGRMIEFVDGTILTNNEIPYEHSDLPCIRFTDIDIPMLQHGQSGIENVKGLTGTYNNILNMITRNQILVSHPKWMMPAGAAKKESLGNDITIVEYKGPVAPQLVQANPTGGETFKFLDTLEQKFQQIYGIYGISRGEPPPGITSGVALQFMAEQEQERFNEDILKYNECIRQVAAMTLSVCGSYYESSDDRMLRVMGKNNEWMSEFFDVANLSKNYDIRVQNTSALPQSKAARYQLLLDLHQQFPDRFNADQFLEMFDLAQSDQFIDAATVNIRTAQAENEKILSGEAELIKLDPQPQEDHIAHWKVHVEAMQKYSFKFDTPYEIQERLQDMVRAHEMFMVNYAKKNPLYAQKLLELSGFPLFYVEQPPIAASPLQPQSMGLPTQGAFPPEQGESVNQPGPSLASEMQPRETLPPNQGESRVTQSGPVEPSRAT